MFICFFFHKKVPSVNVSLLFSRRWGGSFWACFLSSFFVLFTKDYLLDNDLRTLYVGWFFFSDVPPTGAPSKRTSYDVGSFFGDRSFDASQTHCEGNLPLLFGLCCESLVKNAVFQLSQLVFATSHWSWICRRPC